MKVIFSCLILLVSSVSFAGTGLVHDVLPKLNESVEICKDHAVAKLKSFANLTELNPDTVRLVYADYRTLNPSHYAAYQVEVQIAGKTKTIQTSVQLNRLNGGCI